MGGVLVWSGRVVFLFVTNTVYSAVSLYAVYKIQRVSCGIESGKSEGGIALRNSVQTQKPKIIRVIMLGFTVLEVSNTRHFQLASQVQFSIHLQLCFRSYLLPILSSGTS